jgi:hypothetical protein
MTGKTMTSGKGFRGVRACTHRNDRCVLARTLLLAAVALLPLAVGCGGGLERVKMSGKVAYMDQPVVDGMIRFVPKAGTEMPLTIEPIRAGQYDTSTSGGVPVGTYRVEIFAYHPDDPIPTGPGAPPRRQLLPKKYNVFSELEITLESGQKQMTKDFILPQ